MGKDKDRGVCHEVDQIVKVYDEDWKDEQLEIGRINLPQNRISMEQRV